MKAVDFSDRYFPLLFDLSARHRPARICAAQNISGAV
jgi:hypothetical protein